MSKFSKSLNIVRYSPNDIKYTPEDLAKEIINICPLKPGDLVLDPFYGEGVFYNNYPEFCEKEWCEIEKGVDFLDYDKKVNWIISNPPFSKLKIMIPKMIETATDGICLILGTNNLTRLRDRLFNEAGFNLTHIETFQVRTWGGFRCCFVLYEKNKKSMCRLSKTSF